MTHFVDRVPFEWQAPGALELRDLLASAYSRSAPAEQLAKRAGLATGYVNWDGPMMTVWFDLIEKASNQKRLRALLEAVTSGPDQAVGDRVRELLNAHPVVAAPEKPAKAGDFAHFTDPDERERQIFRTGTFQDVVFLRRGTQLATAVCRLRITAADGALYHGTAFRIADDLLLTNHHVLFDDVGKRPAAVEAWFGYEADLNGQIREHRVVPCDPASATGEAGPDWAAVRATAELPDDAMCVSLPDSVSVSVDDRVCIIQHPHGGVKKLAARHNVVRHVDDTVLQYWTDTEQGSSGSPVFDERWGLVALHRRWRRVGSEEQPAEFRNEGVRIERVVEGLARKRLV
ncbi:serine protease [Streptomyces griseoincarnatus]|uniref:Serine protease n=1 Tax=Streptomyces griseoincarnatus TaxID=29305 RepID=A0ABT0VPY5_STRGI|nr:trypsin-like peptidase domain-containing protein [Streptomyces griseoincarnatus]MBJ6616646.1 trypsin-like peptidase domain-containing protein [Streptomyces sp. I3(2020)]MBJ6630114.1 trypsin-like peptidase domain-containing protein [Streptomyces sp. I4(2020)]MCM2513035.1 serine protease [Streptomyces griseoincarnatus]